jgi:dihydroxyacetone kinase-like protein
MASPTTLIAQDWIYIFRVIAEKVEIAQGHLNELDGVIGDGDHGLTMVIGMRAVVQAVSTLTPSATVDQVFNTAGISFANSAGGAIGPLVGGMWTACGKRFPGCSAFGVPELKTMFECMEATIIRKGKAKLGDKTLLDALHPAVQVILNSTESDMGDLLSQAAQAAAGGARSTSAMISRIGRSSRLGERTLGHEDAGANSMALIIAVMAEGVTARIDKGSAA